MIAVTARRSRRTAPALNTLRGAPQRHNPATAAEPVAGQAARPARDTIARLCRAAAAASLTEALAVSIRDVAALHSATCDLDHPGSPAAAVAILREQRDTLDYLVLGDCVLVTPGRPAGSKNKNKAPRQPVGKRNPRPHSTTRKRKEERKTG